LEQEIIDEMVKFFKIEIDHLKTNIEVFTKKKYLSNLHTMTSTEIMQYKKRIKQCEKFIKILNKQR